MLRSLYVTAAAALLALDLHAQDTIPPALPFGASGAEVAAEFEGRDMRVLARGGGRDVHAATHDRTVQAVAVLAADTLVGVVFYHPETSQLNAHDVFARASSAAERRHGPPFCRRSGLAVWELPDGVLEVRLRGSRGDGAPGTEVRYLGSGYDDELARRLAARRSTRSEPSRSPAAAGRGEPRLLGVPVTAASDPPAGDGEVPPAAETPGPDPVADRCA
jgi:hypothetical protein